MCLLNAGKPDLPVSRLWMPDKADAGAGAEGPVREGVPAAIGIPVVVAGVDAAVGIDALDNGDVTIVAGPLHTGL